MRKGRSPSTALQCSCAAVASAFKISEQLVIFPRIASNVSETFRKRLRDLDGEPLAWQMLGPYVNDEVSGLLRPIVKCFQSRDCSVDAFGGAWFKTFIQLQFVKLLHSAGVRQDALQRFGASSSRPFRRGANLEILTYILDCIQNLLLLDKAHLRAFAEIS